MTNDRRETASVALAARLAGVATQTIRNWCRHHSIGRRTGGHWRVSKVALAMLLNGDKAGLRAYLDEEKTKNPKLGLAPQPRRGHALSKSNFKDTEMLDKTKALENLFATPFPLSDKDSVALAVLFGAALEAVDPSGAALTRFTDTLWGTVQIAEAMENPNGAPEIVHRVLTEIKSLEVENG